MDMKRPICSSIEPPANYWPGSRAGRFLLLEVVCALALLLYGYSAWAVEPASDPAIRQQLFKTLLSEGDEQQTNLTQLADSGSKFVHDVLSAWTRDSVYIYEAAGEKTPVLLEDQQDADGKARGIRISDGQFLKDDKGQELR